MAEKKKEVLKGILMGLADYAQNKADEVKYKSKLAITEGKQRENWLWKLQNKQQQEIKRRKAQNLMTENFVKRMRDEAGGGFVNLGPQARMGGEGEIDIHYPSAKEKEFMIKQGLNRVRLKQEKGMPLSPIEQKFKDTYSGMFDKEEKELTPYQIEQGRQRKNKAKGAIQAMLRDEVDEEDIISATMASTGLSAEWVKSTLDSMRSQMPEKEPGLLERGAKGLANIFNF